MSEKEKFRQRRIHPNDGRLLRGEKTRRKIRKAARGLFREQGFDRTTLREIAREAGLGTSSLYRHIQAKEDLLIEELAQMQRESWEHFRKETSRENPVLDRVQDFFSIQSDLLEREKDWTRVALRLLTQVEHASIQSIRSLQDQSIGVVVEILQQGRLRGELREGIDLIQAAQALQDIAMGARIDWAQGFISEDRCRRRIQEGVTLVFQGLSGE